MDWYLDLDAFSSDQGCLSGCMLLKNSSSFLLALLCGGVCLCFVCPLPPGRPHVVAFQNFWFPEHTSPRSRSKSCIKSSRRCSRARDRWIPEEWGRASEDQEQKGREKETSTGEEKNKPGCEGEARIGLDHRIDGETPCNQHEEVHLFRTVTYKLSTNFTLAPTPQMLFER